MLGDAYILRKVEASDRAIPASEHRYPGAFQAWSEATCPTDNLEVACRAMQTQDKTVDHIMVWLTPVSSTKGVPLTQSACELQQATDTKRARHSKGFNNCERSAGEYTSRETNRTYAVYSYTGKIPRWKPSATRKICAATRAWEAFHSPWVELPRGGGVPRCGLWIGRSEGREQTTPCLVIGWAAWQSDWQQRRQPVLRSDEA
jgi:hypothetical protein